MEELLKKLLEAEVLTDETKKELEAAITQKVADVEKKARDEATISVTSELNEKWIQERDTLIEALDEKVSSFLKDELEELREDIERFRDLEAEYAEKLVGAKGDMADELKKDMGQLIEKIDAFLEIRLGTELEELREDIDSEKKKVFGQKMFAAFVDEYKKHFADEDSAEGKLNEMEQRLTDALTELEVATKKATRLERDKKMEEVTKPLTGRTKEVMEAILKNVDTPMLEDAYKTYIGRVLKESTTTEDKKDVKTSEKETKVLAEGEKKEEKEVIKGTVKTGDDNETLANNKKIDESEKHGLPENEKKALQRIAGIPSK